MAISRRTGSGPHVPKTEAIPTCEISVKYPNIVEWIMETSYADGEVRTPGTLSIFRGSDGTIRACITDKDDGSIAFMTGRSVTELLDNLERSLDSGTTDWRQPRPTKGKR